MIGALVVLSLAVAMVVGGMRMIRHGERARLEGLLSCAIGLGLAVGWYDAYPSDFGALVYFVERFFRSDSMFRMFALAGLVPVLIAVILYLCSGRMHQREHPTAVRSFYGRAGRSRDAR